MNPIFYIALSSVLIGALSFYCVYVTGARRPRTASIAAACFFAFSLLSFWSGFETMGTPKPRHLEWRSLANTRVVGLHWTENVAIYLTVLVNGKPVMYVLPWKKKTEDLEKLEKMRRKLKSNEGGDELYFNDNEEEGVADDVIENPGFQLPTKEELPTPVGPGFQNHGL